MQCPKCQFENREGVKFCEECGTKFEFECPACKAKIPFGRKFCGECGHKLVAATEKYPTEISFDEKLTKIQKYLPKGLTEKILAQRDRIEGERKQVTVMFCDMEGFTAFSERLGSEDAYTIMDQIYEILINKVHEYDGTVNEMTGDGIMALFGAPIAMEDAPQRAIRSSLAIHRELARYNDKIRKENAHILLFRMRIGIHTGPVVVGSVGNDLRVEFKAVGDTVNLASRVEGLAEPGVTYITEETYKLTEGLFRVEALGEKKIKGKKHPVKIYRVVATSTRRTRFDVSAERGLTPLVGRDRELELLIDGFERSKTGQGQVFSIVSEAGVGKSRLLYEFRKAVSNEDVTFLEGKCLSYSRGVGYHLHIDVLKANFDIREGDGDLEIREKVKRGLKILGAEESSIQSYIFELLGIKNSGINEVSLSPELKRRQIAEALKRIVLKGSEIRPLILAYEDLHWMDKSSEYVLKYVLESLPEASILIIFTYRPEFEFKWEGRSYQSQITLNRLSNRDSLLMIAHILDAKNLEMELENLILEKTEGIPFFIEEFIKSFKDLQFIEKKGTTYRIAKDSRILSIPSKIQEVIMSRVDVLPEAAKNLIQTFSVAGREISYELIKEVMELSEDELISSLSILKDSELLYERGSYPQSNYIFRHALTQEVAYDSLLTKKRKKIHEKIGRSIEEFYCDKLNEFYEALAFHYSKSDNYKKAYQYLKLSGQKAMRSYSYSEAFNFFKKGLALLDKISTAEQTLKEQIDIRLLLSDCMYPMGYPENSIKVLEDGKKLSEELNDKRSATDFHRKIGYYYGSQGKHLLAIRYIEESFQQIKKIDDFDLNVQTATELCVIYSRVGQYYKIADIAPSILKLVEGKKKESKLLDMTVVSYSRLLSLYGLSLGMLGNFIKGKSYMEKSLLSASEINDPIIMASCEFHYGYFWVSKGDPRLAIEHYQKAIKYCEKAKWTWLIGLANSMLGYANYLYGNLESAKKHAEKGLKILRSQEAVANFHMPHWVLSQIYLDLGNQEKAQGYIQDSLRITQDNDERAFESLSWILLGRVLRKIDPQHIKKAKESILKGIKLAEELKIRPYSAIGYLYMGEVYSDTGQQKKAIEQLKKAKDMFIEMAMDYWLNKAKIVLAKQ